MKKLLVVIAAIVVLGVTGLLVHQQLNKHMILGIMALEFNFNFWE